MKGMPAYCKANSSVLNPEQSEPTTSGRLTGSMVPRTCVGQKAFRNELCAAELEPSFPSHFVVAFTFTAAFTCAFASCAFLHLAFASFWASVKGGLW